MKRITIKDLAHLLSLSPSTVSRALSDHPDISDYTKKRVRETAAELNYSTNLHARLFRKQNSSLIALILPEVNMFYTPNVIRGINKTIGTSDYSLITFLSNDSFKKEKQIIQECLNWAVEGVLISLSKQTYSVDHLKPLSDAKINCIMIDKSIENSTYPSVIIDSEEASYKAVNYLLNNGHKNVLGIFGSPALDISQKRLNGYRKAFVEKNLPIEEENIIFIDQSDNLDFILPPILQHNKGLTAVFTMSDELLSKSLYHINRLGFSIPEDLSIVSISDGDFPFLVFPRITHIKDSGSKMGKSASSLLLDCIQGRKLEDQTILLSTKLLELNSVRKLPHIP